MNDSADVSLAALRFVRACFRANNSFLHRNFVKGDLLVPLLALLEEEGSRDNMLSSACMEVLDLIRKVSLTIHLLAHWKGH